MPGVWTAGDVDINESATLTGPIFLGEGVKIGPHAEIIGPTVLRDYVSVDVGAIIDSSIVWRNTYIGERSELHGALVGRQCALKSRVILEEGSVIGDHTIVGDHARVRAQVKVWPDKQIESGAVIGSSLIWGAQGRRGLFGRFGVTGIVNIDLTPEFVARLGAAYASTLKQGATITMNRDQHRSSRMLKRGLMSGIVSAGVHVADLSQAPLPIGRFHTRRVGAAGGVHVRVSPFDVRVCDVKFFDRQALDMDKTQERKVETVFFREDIRRVGYADVGRIFESERVGEAYSEAFLAEITHRAEIAERKFKIVVNYSHGTAAQFLPPLLNTLGIELIAINGVVSENVGSRSFDEFQTERRELAAIVAALKASAGVIIDAGGEKVFFVDDEGRSINDMHFLAAFAALSARVPPGVVAVPVYAPSAIEGAVAEFGGKGRVVRGLAQDPRTEHTRQIDGVKHQNDGEWVLVLPDGDRPLFNVYAEAKDEARAWSLAQEYADRLERLRAEA